MAFQKQLVPATDIHPRPAKSPSVPLGELQASSDTDSRGEADVHPEAVSTTHGGEHTECVEGTGPSIRHLQASSARSSSASEEIRRRMELIIVRTVKVHNNIATHIRT